MLHHDTKISIFSFLKEGKKWTLKTVYITKKIISKISWIIPDFMSLRTDVLMGLL